MNTPNIEELRKKLAQYRSQAEYFFSKAATEGRPAAKAELHHVAETWCQLAVGAETLIREMEKAKNG